MSKIMKIKNVSDYSRYLGHTDRHPLVSVINYAEVSPIRHSLNSYSVYGIFFHDQQDIDLTYGCGKYDYKSGTVICVAPGQIGGKEDNGERVMLTGWALLFHPDLLRGTTLSKNIKQYTFFDYRVHEALHMTEEEHDIFVSLMQQIRNELQKPHDELQNAILIAYIELVLNFCQRFYNRQFTTRKLENSVITKTTGDTASNYIRQHVIQRVKNELATGASIVQVADDLGFKYPQHLSRMFKQQTGSTPSEYCERLRQK